MKQYIGLWVEDTPISAFRIALWDVRHQIERYNVFFELVWQRTSTLCERKIQARR
jgi:hypothetical protein